MAHWITKRAAISHGWRNNWTDSGSESGVNFLQHLHSEPAECQFSIETLSVLHRRDVLNEVYKICNMIYSRGNI